MTLTPAQVKEARRLLGWSQVRLAGKAGLNESRVASYESKKAAPASIIAMMRSALEGAGVEFDRNGSDVKLRVGE